MNVEMLLEENYLTLRVNRTDFSLCFLPHPLINIKQKCNIIYLLRIVNQIQQVNKQKRIEKQSAKEHILVKLLLQQGVM